MLVIRRSKLYYTASGTVTLVGGRPVHRLREEIKTVCTDSNRHMLNRTADCLLASRQQYLFVVLCTVLNS